jgi:hypothetical protein
MLFPRLRSEKVAPAGQLKIHCVAINLMGLNLSLFYLNVINLYNRSAQKVKVFENFVSLFYIN